MKTLSTVLKLVLMVIILTLKTTLELYIMIHITPWLWIVLAFLLITTDFMIVDMLFPDEEKVGKNK